MNKHLLNFLKGMADLWPVQPRGYMHPTGGGFSRDAQSMRGDFGHVARDLRKSLKKHEQTTTH